MTVPAAPSTASWTAPRASRNRSSMFTSTQPSPLLTGPLSSLQSLLALATSSDLPPTKLEAVKAELARAAEIIAAMPIEYAEFRASPKQLAFQRAFFDRRDPDDGREL